MTEPLIEHLTSREHNRRALHRAVDTIARVWPHALVDASARGFSGGAGDGTGRSVIGGHSDPTGRIALTPGHAVAWLSELGDVLIAHRLAGHEQPVVIARLHELAETLVDGDHRKIDRLADNGNDWWPPPPKRGETVGGVTVGKRSSDVGTCAYCGNPTVSSNGSGGRRWVQDPKTGERREFHKSPCWYRYTMDRKAVNKGA